MKHGQAALATKDGLLHPILLHQMPLLILNESLAYLHLILFLYGWVHVLAGNGRDLSKSHRVATHTLSALQVLEGSG